MAIHTISSLSKEQKDLHYISRWRSKDDSIPVYHADTPHSFNRAIGYARYKNSASGTVLYRGQDQLYDHLLPSGARKGKSAVSEDIFDCICENQQMMKFLGLERKEIKGWREYNYLLIEAVLQHYGASTYCMDFVDNHWCALWFGLYMFENNHYFERTDDGNLYIFLYLAETEGPCVEGMYIGDTTYTVDLRKALPSTFQRPASQHGWVVRQKNRVAESLDDHVVGIIEVSVNDAKKWLGNGVLLSEENFFPSFTIDVGYKVLLSRQYKSGLFNKDGVVLPQNTICNYHMHEMIFCSNFEKLLELSMSRSISKEIKAANLMDLFSVLLNGGWDENTCADISLWDIQRPYIGQSAATAILIQRWFGGEICSIRYSSRSHYFNIINGITVDLTHSELQHNPVKNYYDPSSFNRIQSRSANVYKTNKSKVDQLIKNCKNVLSLTK